MPEVRVSTPLPPRVAPAGTVLETQLPLARVRVVSLSTLPLTVTVTVTFSVALAVALAGSTVTVRPAGDSTSHSGGHVVVSVVSSRNIGDDDVLLGGDGQLNISSRSGVVDARPRFWCQNLQCRSQ